MTTAPTTDTTEPRSLKRSDVFALLAFALLLFGYAAVSFKPLTMHEARLPELAREMTNTGVWTIPHSGGRPWVERPPLPQWIVAVFFKVFGASVGVARIPGAIAGALTCLFAAMSAARLFGRTIGILAGFALATTYEFYVYATLAEDEVYLASIVMGAISAFVYAFFPRDDGSNPTRRPVLLAMLFFAALAFTNLVRGPIVGVVQIGSIVGSFLVAGAVIDRRFSRVFAPWGPIVWIIGLALALALGAAWYRHCGSAVPSLYANLRYDYFSGWGADPWWYYAIALCWTTQPWLVFALLAMKSTATRVLPDRATLFAWCWAIAPALVMSIPARKGHHYLVPVLAGWSTLGAVGLKAVWDWGCSRNAKPGAVIVAYSIAGVLIGVALFAIAAKGAMGGPVYLTGAAACAVAALVVSIGIGASRKDGVHTIASFLACFLVIGCWTQTAYYVFDDKRMADADFVRGADKLVPLGAPLFIVHKESLDFFLLQFYSRPDAKLLHNVTWLLDRSITAPEIYVITRSYDRDWIQQHVGNVEVIGTAIYSRREEELGGAVARWTLLRVRYRPDVQRFDAKPIDALQAMKRPDWRDESPYLGTSRPEAIPPGAKPAEEAR